MRQSEKGLKPIRAEAEALDHTAVRRAIIVGTALQVSLAILAHISQWISLHALLFGAMMISAVAGYLYAQDVARGFAAGAFGGVIAGGVCGLFGVAVSIVLGDTDSSLLIQNTLILVFT